MVGFSFRPSSFLLFLLLSFLLLHHHRLALAAPNSQHDLAAEEKSPLWSGIRTGSGLSSVNRKGGGGRGGGGSIGGGGSRGRGRGGGGGGGGIRGDGDRGRVPLYSVGAAGGAAGGAWSRARRHHNGAAPNRGKPSPLYTLAVAVLLVVALLFKHCS